MGIWASRARHDNMQLTKNGPVDVSSSDGSIEDEKSDMADHSEPSSSADLHDSGITDTDDEPWGINVIPPDTVTLHWGPPARGVIRALSYIVEKRDPSDQDWVPVVILDADITSYVIRDLDLRSEHWFRVLARSSMGLTTVLETDRPVQLREDEPLAAERPDPPSTPLLVVVTGPFSMDVKWTAPLYDGGRPVLGYVVAVKEPRRTLWMEVSQVNAPTLKTQIQDLEEGHEYLVRIYAWNEVGVSEPLETPEGTKIVRPPGVVVPPSAPVGPLVIEEVTENSVRLSWKPPLNAGGDAVANYIVEYRDVSAAEIAKFSLRTPDARTRFTVEDLKCRHFYVFRVSAENQAGVGDALVDKKPVRVQAAPKKPPAPDPPVVVVHPTMPDACIVTWAPPCDGVTLYVLERCDLVGDVWIVVSQQREAEFVAQNLVPGIEYSFRVSAENECGMGKWSKPSEPIVITRKVASMTAPEFTKLLSDVNVLVDNDACFTCQFTGKPTPEITWYKGGQELFESPRADIDTSLASSTLTLKQVRLEDKGKIECQALNNAGLKTTSAKLTVLAPPKLISSPAYKDGLMFDSGETLRVKLSYTGHPPPTFVWKRNDQPLTFEDPNCSVTVDSEDQTILFKIVDADCNHRGTYSLEATNEHGSDVFSVDIMITGEPDPPSLPPEITSVDWTSCTLAWKPTDNDGGSPVSSYVVEKRLMDNELWLKATTTHHEHCTVYGLEEGAKYAFRLRAVTVYGTSKPGPSTEPVSLPRLDSRGDTLATEVESTEQTEAIATEQELGSIEEDVTLTVTKYDSDDQRSSLDVDEFLNEDAAVSEVVSQVTAPLAPSELSDYETLVPSSTVKVESVEVSEIDNDTLAKRASLETSDVAVCKAVPIEEAVVAATEEEPLLEAPLLPEPKRPSRFALENIRTKLFLCSGRRAQWNMYRNLLPESSFLIIDVSEPLLVLAPPLELESTSMFVDPERTLPIVCRFTLSERLPLAINYIIDTLLTESNLRRLQQPSRACCSVEYIETVPSPMAIITTVKPNEPVPRIVTPQASPELLLEHPIYEKRRELLSASPADSGVDTSFGYQRPILRSTKPQAGEYYGEFYMHDALYYKKAARVKEFDVRTRRSYSRRITSLSRSIEHDYSVKKTNIDRLESRISSEMSSLERDLELLRSMQSMLRRELKTRERPSGDQNGGKESTSGRKADGTSDSSATSRVRPYPESGSRGYMSRRLSRSDSSDSEEPQPVKLRAKPQPKGEAPRFVTRLDNRIAPSGYRIKLHCTVVGDPMPQVTWLKNGIKVTPDSRHMEITLTDFGMCSLEIYNVKPDDTAEYTCYAVNAYGDATTSAYLRITGERDETPEEPRFESCAPDLSVRPGGKAVFSWRATGSPTPTLKVMKDSRPLRTNLTTDVIISKDGVCRVCIAKVTPEDAGVFTCTAENDSGTAVSTSILRIAGQEDSSEEFQEERRRLEEMHMQDKRQPAAAVERESKLSRPQYDLPPEEDKEEYYKPRRHFKTYGMLGLNYLEDVPRTTHEPFSVPGPPLDPVITETGPTSATLVWTKPIYNGGLAHHWLPHPVPRGTLQAVA
ncbi:titin-like [Rhipicephalus sanguineus]|uniref:titin-like n=1 Tax=Rhipicephalus sanguineus TaxID=34632 RepID=UPI0020C246FB|nr:titin-like [Rhipicephalus sanguineus]